eukprot:COSAG05_NODE_6211_length_997_cov_40.830923_2_plen_77_part_01
MIIVLSDFVLAIRDVCACVRCRAGAAGGGESGARAEGGKGAREAIGQFKMRTKNVLWLILEWKRYCWPCCLRRRLDA